MPKKVYKTTRKYQCPYCDMKLPRMDLIDHVERKHEEMIPENYSGARVVYEAINKTDHGICMICKKPVYEWNEKVSRYNNLCGSKKCREEVRRIALERHIKVYNKPTLLGDPEHQEKMLAHRHISGKYKYSDGTEFTYTGKYEKATIEFMDKVMNIKSSDIQMPGPILEYEYKDEKHAWITDIYYIPANLIIEVKDGGNNPNNRNMPDYRGKQSAKEIMITNLGKFNYLRLTNNDFGQLLEALAEIKFENMDQSTAPRLNSFINESISPFKEEVGGIPPRRPNYSNFIIPYSVNNAFDLAIGSDRYDTVLTRDENDGFKVVGLSDFIKQYRPNEMLVYTENDSESKYLSIMNNKYPSMHEAIEFMIGKRFRVLDELALDERIRCIDLNSLNISYKLIETGVIRENEILSGAIQVHDKSNMPIKGAVLVARSSNGGYFIHTPEDYYLSSEIYDNVEDIPQNIIDTMADLYDQFKQREGRDSYE